MEDQLIETVIQYKKSDLFSYADNKERLYISFTFHSNAIEGNTMTLEETEAIYTIERFSEKKPIKDNLEILDHKNAIQFLLRQAKQKTKISKELIKQISAYVLKNTGSITNTPLGEIDNSKGEYRKSGVIAGTTLFPDAQKIPALMKSLIENYSDIETTSIIDAINTAASIHFDFVSIHPFYDGNGRTARLLMNYIMTINNLPFIVLNKENKQQYIDSLRKTRKNEDINIFQNFVKEQYLIQLNNELLALKNSQSKGNFFFNF